MGTKRLSVQIPDRELAIAAWALQMTDCTRNEIGNAIILTGAGLSRERAKSEVLSHRTSVQLTDGNTVRSFYISEQRLNDAMDNEDTPQDLSPSERFRYWCHRLTEDPSEALQRARVPQGRPRKVATA